MVAWHFDLALRAPGNYFVAGAVSLFKYLATLLQVEVTCMTKSLRQHPAALPVLLTCLRAAAFGLYIAYLIVPEILQAVVPTVVEKVVNSCKSRQISQQLFHKGTGSPISG